MRYIIIFWFLVFPFLVEGQSFKPDLDTESSYKREPAYLLDTVSGSDLDKVQLYSNALDFVSKLFEDSRAVIEMKDMDLGEVAFAGTLEVAFVDTVMTERRGKVREELVSDAVDLHFKCKVYVKDQKFKVVLYALKVPANSFLSDLPITLSMYSNRPSNEAGKAAALGLIEDVSSYLNRPPANDF